MIRRFKDSDFEQIEEIYNLSKADEFAYEDFQVEIVPLSLDPNMLSLLKRSTLYVYENDSILGFIGYEGGFITWLFVHPNSRGKGIGEALLEYLILQIGGSLSLTVARSNKVAMNLYSKFGFSVEKEFTGNYQGNPIAVCKLELHHDDALNS